MKAFTCTSLIVIFFLIAITLCSDAYAQVPVSASVPNSSLNPPTLLIPGADATENTTRPTFSWLRPSPLPASPLNHYDLFLDGAVFASGLADSLTSVDLYFYSATASAGTFYVTLKTDLAEGYHTWSVTAYNDAGVSASSETRTFYIDSIPPFISVTKVHQTTLTWNTSIPSSIPDVQNRYFSFSVPNQVLSGDVEVSSNFQIILVCPTNIPTCTNQTYTTNALSGMWSFNAKNLVNGGIYTVKISATDASGNSTLFPDFFLTYTSKIPPTPTNLPTKKPSPTLTIIPTVSPLATPSGVPTLPLPETTLTPPSELLDVITPAPFDYSPPLAPTPPPAKDLSVQKRAQDLFFNFLLVLVILGLPLHLLMSLIATQTPLAFVHKFLFILAFPFLRNKKYRTTPFTFINIFISDKLDRPWQSVVSDIKGFYDLKDPIPENIFINLSAVGKTWRDTLTKGTLIPISCLYPVPERPLTSHSKLLKVIYDTRIIPLIIACLTSITVVIISPSTPVGIYAYLSVQYLFSEYLYPKITK